MAKYSKHPLARAVMARTKTAGPKWDAFKEVATSPYVALPAGLTIGGAAIRHAESGIDRMLETRRKTEAYKEMLAQSPQLRRRDQAQVQRYYNTLYRTNPTMAKDPTVASAWIHNVIESGNQYGAEDGPNPALLNAVKDMANVRHFMSGAMDRERTGPGPMSEIFQAAAKPVLQYHTEGIGDLKNEVGELRGEINQLEGEAAKSRLRYIQAQQRLSEASKPSRRVVRGPGGDKKVNPGNFGPPRGSVSPTYHASPPQRGDTNALVSWFEGAFGGDGDD